MRVIVVIHVTEGSSLDCEWSGQLPHEWSNNSVTVYRMCVRRHTQDYPMMENCCSDTDEKALQL